MLDERLLEELVLEIVFDYWSVIRPVPRNCLVTTQKLTISWDHRAKLIWKQWKLQLQSW